MAAILAIETATDACSVAVYRDGEYQQCHELAPREHAQRVFGMLNELLPHGKLREQGIEAIAYGCGPGSFTGLRIAASAVQGLAFANDLPAIPISTLACQAATALRLGVIDGVAPVLSALDARINEIYAALYRFEEGIPQLQWGPVACAPGALQLDTGNDILDALGSGCNFISKFPPGLVAALRSNSPAVEPEARDLVPIALEMLRRGEVQGAAQVQPVYVRDEISWKKLAEQGKPS
jgi:tRNA threonylcarbamoyladenosine biosynthesis protein TsaB